MLRVALAKGRLLDSFIDYLQRIKQIDMSEALLSRKRLLLLTVDSIEFILVKGSDVPTYVEQGIADVGIVGSDVLNEHKFNINNLLDLPFGKCHFALASKPQTTAYKKVATSYIHTATQYFANQGMDVELIYLNGSVELSCLVDMVDGIVDIVQTGTTLKANGLVEKRHIGDINAKLITNKEAYFKKSTEIERLIKQLGVSIDYA
ncbi:MULTISPECIES: ATP phosphoribosyltransferase [Staphylococcus]|uniref:ATP phosphoribosyltransferase n=1 Tax=Staphylococcus TaxID=1279 RepID=UPI000CD1626D|nr:MULTISPECIES: ATP phosphoribosyltransferase [Staphylococcus]MDI9230690.1 ATP phosphoribosyltransferase [Staphylococcus caprae]POA04638.1 ATP phosphoribosyltransferase [Staphylococcus caprae]SUL94398.1 ATP phosphoribosyltransferase [Staphylococcus caprae]HCG74384.1 ATP phosphoribosyltransferase [Staphylococcus sp.]